MSDPREEGSSPCRDEGRDERLQQAFDRAAAGLDLRLERSPLHDSDDIRVVGTAFVAETDEGLAHATQFDLMESPPPVGAADDAAISALLTSYESQSPEDLVANWRQYATDPHVVLGEGWMSFVDKKDYHHFLRSDELAHANQEFPPYSPRHVTITNLNVVYIRDTRASVTYHLQEEYTNGKVAAGNSAAWLVKLSGGEWRIAAVQRWFKTLVSP